MAKIIIGIVGSVMFIFLGFRLLFCARKVQRNTLNDLKRHKFPERIIRPFGIPFESNAYRVYLRISGIVVGLIGLTILLGLLFGDVPGAPFHKLLEPTP